MEATNAAQRAERARQERLRARERRRERHGADWDDTRPPLQRVVCVACGRSVDETWVEHSATGATCGPCQRDELDAAARKARWTADRRSVWVPLLLSGLALVAPWWAPWDMGFAGAGAATVAFVGSLVWTVFSALHLARARRERRLAATGFGPPVHPWSLWLRLVLLLWAPLPAAFVAWLAWVWAS